MRATNAARLLRGRQHVDTAHVTKREASTAAALKNTCWEKGGGWSDGFRHTGCCKIPTACGGEGGAMHFMRGGRTKACGAQGLLSARKVNKDTDIGRLTLGRGPELHQEQRRRH